MHVEAAKTTTRTEVSPHSTLGSAYNAALTGYTFRRKAFDDD